MTIKNDLTIMFTTVRKGVDFNTVTPVIQMNHGYGTDKSVLRHTKAYRAIRAYDLPHWGYAKDLITKFK